MSKYESMEERWDLADHSVVNMLQDEGLRLAFAKVDVSFLRLEGCDARIPPPPGFGLC